jgi:hypothetical protein
MNQPKKCFSSTIATARQAQHADCLQKFPGLLAPSPVKGLVGAVDLFNLYDGPEKESFHSRSGRGDSASAAQPSAPHFKALINASGRSAHALISEGRVSSSALVAQP